MTVDEALDAIRDIVIVAENDGYGITGPLGKALGDLIAVVQAEQYDAILAAIPEWDAMVPLTSHAPDALRRAYADGWRDGWNAHRISTLNCIAQHNPRKGAE